MQETQEKPKERKEEKRKKKRIDVSKSGFQTVLPCVGMMLMVGDS